MKSTNHLYVRIMAVLAKDPNKRFTVKDLKKEEHFSEVPRLKFSNTLRRLVRNELVAKFPLESSNTRYEYCIRTDDIISPNVWIKLLSFLESCPEISEENKQDPNPLF